MYLNGRWEIVDVNAGIRSARVGTDNKTYAANVKAYWAKQKTGDDYTTVGPFCITAYNKFKVSAATASPARVGRTLPGVRFVFPLHEVPVSTIVACRHGRRWRFFVPSCSSVA